MARKHEGGRWSAPQAEALALEFLRRVCGERDLGTITATTMDCAEWRRQGHRSASTE